MKKLLSILLTTSMLVSVFAISASAFVPTTVNPVDVYQTFDGTDEENFTQKLTDAETAYAPTIEDGKLTVVSSKHSSMGFYAGILSTTQPTTTNYTLQFDITRDKDITYTNEESETVTLTEHAPFKATVAFMLPRNTDHAALGAFGIWLPMDGAETGKKRTFSITIDESVAANATAQQVSNKSASGAVAVFTEVKYMDEGDTEWTYHSRSGSSQTAYEYRVFGGESSAKNTADNNGTFKNSDNAGNINSYSDGITIGSRLMYNTTDDAFEAAFGDIPYTYDNISITSYNYSYPITEGIKLSHSLEAENSAFAAFNAPTSTVSAIDITETTESNGNTFYRLSPTANLVRYLEVNGTETATVTTPQWLGTYATTTTTDCNVYPNSVVTLDVRYVTKGIPLTLLVSKNTDYYESTADGKKPLSLMLHPREIGKWYTYKIEMGNFTTSDSVDDFITVYVKERGAADSTYTKLSGTYIGGAGTKLVSNPSQELSAEQVYMDDYGYSYGISWGTIAGGKTGHIGYQTYKLTDAGWTNAIIQSTVTDIDNFQIRDKVAFSGDNATVENGVLSSVLTIDTAEEAPAAAIVAVYNADGRLADVSFDAIAGGSDNIAANTVDFDAATQDAILYIWSDISTETTVPLTAPFTGLIAE